MPDINDPVNHPSHYNQGGIECIEAIRAFLSEEEMRGYLKGQVVKYIWRARLKGLDEDHKKAQWYLNYLVSSDDKSIEKTEKEEREKWLESEAKRNREQLDNDEPRYGTVDIESSDNETMRIDERNQS